MNADDAMSFAIPRRIRLDQNSAAELAIRSAIHAVEALPADVRLTDAVVLLQEARENVADYVDGVYQRPSALPTGELAALRERHEEHMEGAYREGYFDGHGDGAHGFVRDTVTAWMRSEAAKRAALEGERCNTV